MVHHGLRCSSRTIYRQQTVIKLGGETQTFVAIEWHAVNYVIVWGNLWRTCWLLNVHFFGAIGDISVQNKHILSIDTLPHMWLQISCFDTEQKICCGNHRGLRHRHFVLLSVALPQVNDSYWSTLPARPSGGSFSFPSKVNCFTLGALYPGMFSMSLMLSIHLFSSFSGGKKGGGGVFFLFCNMI